MKLFGFELSVRRASAASPVSGPRGGWYPLVREPFTGAWQRNQEIRVESVLSHPTVYACVTQIADDLAKLRPRLVHLDEDTGIWTEVRSRASPFPRLLRKPNRYQNHQQFKESWAISKLVHGNTYVLKERDGRRMVRALYVLDPSRVTVLVAPDGEVLYRLNADNLAGVPEDTEVVVPSSDIIHDRMSPLFHPLIGVPPLFAAGGPADMGLEIQSSSRSFFGSGSNPSGILTSPEHIPPDKAAEMREQWQSRYGPGGPGGVAVLGFGMRFEPMRMSSVEAQVIEQLGWSDEAICKAFKIPAFKVGVGQMPTYSNGEILNQRYYDDCLQRHIEAWEELMDEGLGLTAPMDDGRQLGVDLDLDGLLRMDSATQIKTLAEGTRGGVLAPNEARQKLDLPPLEGGDTIYLQHQDYPMEQVYNRTDLDPQTDSDPMPPDSGGELQRAAAAVAIELETMALEAL